MIGTRGIAVCLSGAIGVGCSGPSSSREEPLDAASDGPGDAAPSAVDASFVPEAAAPSPDADASLATPVTTLANTPRGSGALRSHGSPGIVVHGSSAVTVFDDTDEDLTAHAVGWARSTDACGSFTDEGSLPDPTPSGVDDIGYPVVARDATIGAVYIASDGRVSGTSNYGALAFFVSEDDGVTFHPAVDAADPNLAPGDFVDVPAIAVDNTGGYWQGLVYVAYADVVGGTTPVKLRLSTYLDRSFAVTEVVSPEPGDEAALPSIAVAPDESVGIAYYSQVAGQPSIAFVRSTDQGAHFATPVTVAALHTPVVASELYGGLGLMGVTPAGTAAPLDAYPSPVLAVNPASSALYVAYVDATQGDKANIYLVHSEDAGASWSSPVRVNDDSTSNDQFLPSIAVSGDGTRLAVDFYDRRNDALNLWADRYAATASVGVGAPAFGANFRVSPVGFPVTVGADPSLQAGYFSIHTGLVAAGASFYDAYADTTDGELDVRVARYGILLP